MTRLAKSHKKQAESTLTLLTVGLIISGFILLYFGSLALTPEDAHLIHWGLAFAGGAAGWAIGLIVERGRR